MYLLFRKDVRGEKSRFMLRRLFLFLFLHASVACLAQRDVDDRSPLKDRLYFGGGLGFGTGTGYTQFSLSPLVGYMVTPKFSTGMGIIYQGQFFNNFSLQQYGVSPFARYNLSRELFLYGEYQFINSPSFSSNDRTIYTRTPVGLGYALSSNNGRGGLNIVGLYDLSFKAGSIFQTPWVLRAFVTF
jgi:hypothetical protein